MSNSPLSEPYVSILIPTRNNARVLIHFLKSLENLEYPLNRIETIIWDKNSEPENKRIIKEFILQLTGRSFMGIRLIENSNNFGAFSSRDELLKLTHHNIQYILSIDDDVILPPELISVLLSAISHDESIGIVGPLKTFKLTLEVCEKAF